jgi:hypothetical protein
VLNSVIKNIKGKVVIQLNNHTKLAIFISLLFVWGSAQGAATNNDEDKTVNFATLTIENDIIAGDDGGYTNGLAFSWAHGGFDAFNDSNTPSWINALSENLYISTMPGKRRAVSYMVAQGMQTSSDIERKELAEDEPPYAGELIWKATLYAFDDSVSDRLSLSLGVVGPLSGAEHAQKFVHKITGSDEPEGWDHQLENEFVFRLGAQRFWSLWRSSSGNDTQVEVLGNTQIGVGNLKSDLGAGLGFRWGNNLASSFATASTIPGREINPLAGLSGFNWNFFIHVTGLYVANNILIDGNTFESSHSVPLKHGQAIGSLGFALNRGSWGFVISAARSSDQYEGQEDASKFGSFSFTYKY